MIRITTGILLLIFFVSCNPYPKDVMVALDLAGDNREELIKVLDCYKGKDSLKYEAACFLVANMPYHQTKRQLILDSAYFEYFRMTDSICTQASRSLDNDSLKMKLKEMFELIPSPQELDGSADIKVLNAEFLIDNIERSFELWKQTPFLKNISFEDFKEWILPYRVADESIIGSKELYHDLIYKILSNDGMDDIRKPVACYCKYVLKQKKANSYIKSKKHISLFDLFIPAFEMDCHNLGVLTCNYFRSCGVPVVYEFTPQYPNNRSGHYWCASPDSSNQLKPYTPPYNNLNEDWDMNLKVAGKIYQRGFAVQKNAPYFLKAERESIPSKLNIPTLKDVSYRYRETTTLTLPFNVITDNNLAYLCFFNPMGNNPVAWGKINKDKKEIVYEQVPLNLLFFPTYFNSTNEMVCFSKPFKLIKDINGKIVKKEIEAEEQTKNIRVYRKHPLKRPLEIFAERMQGAVLIASNQLDGKFDTLFTLSIVLKPYLQEFKVRNTQKYRYYKFLTKNDIPINVAEFEFLGKKVFSNNCVMPTALPVFNEKDTLRKDNLYKIEGIPLEADQSYAKAYDNDPDTYISSPYLGMDFKVPVCISAIRLMPRNAMNIVEPNCNYQLLYYGTDGWVDFKKIRSRYNYLDFENVPANTIYWLRNLDKGKEELPFYYNDGKQIFISESTK